MLTKRTVVLIGVLVFAVSLFLSGCQKQATVVSSDPPQDSPANLESLLEAGKIEKFQAYAIVDPQVNGLEVSRTMLPHNWNAQSQVYWDLQSVIAPARYLFTANTTDGQAGLLMASDMHYVEMEYADSLRRNMQETVNNGLPVLPRYGGIPLAEKLTSAFFPEAQNVQLTNLYSIDQGKELENYYLNTIAPTFQQLRTGGMTVENPHLWAEQVVGTATINGVLCDLYVDQISTGYSMYVTSSQPTVRATSHMWNVLYLALYYAPTGQMPQYISDVETMTNNMTYNQNWMALRNEVSTEVYAAIRQQQLADWAAVNQLSEQLRQNAAARASKSSIYDVISERSEASSFYHERWSDVLTGQEAYSLGGNDAIKVDNRYDYVWRSNTGEIVGSNDSGFDPNLYGSGSYTQLEKLKLRS